MPKLMLNNENDPMTAEPEDFCLTEIEKDGSGFELGYNYISPWIMDAAQITDVPNVNNATQAEAYMLAQGYEKNGYTNPTTYEFIVMNEVLTFSPHTHTAGTEWKTDAANHWHECTANDGAVLDKAAHTWDAGVETTKATTEAEGVRTYTCTVCKATKTEAIPKLAVSGNGDIAGTTGTGSDSGTAQKIEVEEGTSTKDSTGATYVVTESGDGSSAEAEYKAPASTRKKVTIPSSVTIDGVEVAVTSIAENAFSGNKKVTTVSIPSTVTKIGAKAFKGCTKLSTVTVPKSVKKIGKNAFSGCSSLKKVTIKSTTITKIEQGSFKNCKKLTSITITKSVKTIEKEAFSGDKKLKTITIKSTKITSFGKNAFKNVPKTATIKVPAKVKKSYTKKLKKAGFKGKIK